MCDKTRKGMEMTILVQEDDGWFIGQIAEYPAAIDQARSLPELKERLTEALLLLLDVQREQTMADYEKEGELFTIEKLSIASEEKRLAQAS